jgi:predicted RNA-binding Zn-ribbon protein involved in translation (DUF1610 family)
MTGDDALWLDGNALAGTLVEVFGADMTTARWGCPSCGSRSPLGAHRLYLGAGAVLRCPNCGELAMRIALCPEPGVVQLSGSWTLELART